MLFSLTIVFFLRVRSRTLCAQWTCHVTRTRLSCTPVSCATGSCTRTFPSHLMCSLLLVLVPLWIVNSSPVTCLSPVSPFVLSTRLLMFLAYVFLLLCCRLVSMLTFTAYTFPFQFVDSSPVSLFLDSDSLPSHFPFLYLCTCISRTAIYTGWRCGSFPIFNLLCNHPKGVTCEIPRTLPILSSSLAKATALWLLGSSPLFRRLPVVKSSLRSVLWCARNRRLKINPSPIVIL